MFSKSILLFGAVVAFSAVDVAAHAAINPALGVQGTAARNDVERPSNNKPCGNAALTAIDTSTAVTADASGSFTVDIENFNGGRDGSRSVTMQVDAAGTGANFVAGQVTANGEAAPASTGTEKITASIPAGTTCTGGTAGNLCLASFKTAGGFGNCVVVQQGAGGGAGAGAGAGGNAANAGGANAGAGNGNANAGAGNGAANAGNGNTGNGGNRNGGNGGNVNAGNAANAGNGNARNGANNNNQNAATGNTGAGANTGNANGGRNGNARNQRSVGGARLARYVVVDQD